jgi:hypothetical protein
MAALVPGVGEQRRQWKPGLPRPVAWCRGSAGVRPRRHRPRRSLCSAALVEQKPHPSCGEGYQLCLWKRRCVAIGRLLGKVREHIVRRKRLTVGTASIPRCELKRVNTRAIIRPRRLHHRPRLPTAMAQPSLMNVPLASS